MKSQVFITVCSVIVLSVAGRSAEAGPEAIIAEAGKIQSQMKHLSGLVYDAFPHDGRTHAVRAHSRNINYTLAELQRLAHRCRDYHVFYGKVQHVAHLHDRISHLIRDMARGCPRHYARPGMGRIVSLLEESDACIYQLKRHIKFAQQAGHHDHYRRHGHVGYGYDWDRRARHTYHKHRSGGSIQIGRLFIRWP